MGNNQTVYAPRLSQKPEVDQLWDTPRGLVKITGFTASGTRQVVLCVKCDDQWNPLPYDTNPNCGFPVGLLKREDFRRIA